jgi:very-short-patch-repair endonuclease/ribonuclease HI
MTYPYQTANEEYEILKAFAKQNRSKPTEAESLLWKFLQNRQSGHKFRRQHIIKDYIVDFVCLHQKIVIEVDGEYHLQEGQMIKDTQRTEDLRLQGFKVIRFTNEEVLFNSEAVFTTIKEQLMSNEQTINNELPSPLPMEGSGVAPGLPLPLEVSASAWAVDAACSGNPGMMEYQGIDLATGQQVFHFGPVFGTNNIGEFLAIVHALALQQQMGICKTIYSDSYNAILWVNKKRCKTTLPHNPETEQLHQIIARAENWLRTNTFHNPIIKWETAQWGEIPADFGRK